MPLLPSQKKVIDLINDSTEQNERLFILWYGGIRAGKTYGMVRGGIAHSIYREHTNYIVGGYVLRSIINNIAPYFREICEEIGIEYKIVTGGINPRVEIGTNQFLFYGGDRQNRSKNVQGATAAGLLIDEVELLDRDFVKQCEGRISKDNALRIYTSNKGQPYSWAKLDYFDKIQRGEIDGVIIDSNPEENNFIGDEFWEEKRTEYDDKYRRRFIDNEFTPDNEALYNVEYVDIEDEEECRLEFTTIYSYGVNHFSIPVYKNEDVYIIGEIRAENSPVDVDNISRYAPVLLNSQANLLAREFKHRNYTVRGYSEEYAPHKYEICQRAFSHGNVKVKEDAELTTMAIETYAFPGVVENPFVSSIESSIEYLTRMNRWQ